MTLAEFKPLTFHPKGGLDEKKSVERHYTNTRLRKIFNKARKKAGYTFVTLNVFGRHSLGYQLQMVGATDEEIADVLGNTPDIARDTYTHVEALRTGKIISLLDRLANSEQMAQKQG